MEDWEGQRSNHLVHQDKLSKEDEGKQRKDIQEMPSLTVMDLQKTDIMPLSLSQADKSVLEQLPQELRVVILHQLPEHRKLGSSSNSSLRASSKHLPASADVFHVENHLKLTDSVSNHDLWVGSPPRWVDEFSESTCVILNVLATMYYKSGSTGNLSSILRCAILESQHLRDEGYECLNESLLRFSEVLKQYVKLKIKVDIEEIYICFRLLQRFKLKSKFLSHVYGTVVPFLQSSVNETYGGNLNLPAG